MSWIQRIGGFLGVGTTFDIFQNIYILYLQYGVLSFSGYGVLIMFPSLSLHKPELRPTKDFEAKYNKVKAKLALLSSSASASKASTVKNKGLIAEAYEWDEEEVSSDDNEMVEVKVLMALAEDNDDVSKEGARNGEWVKISMRKCDIKKPIWYLDSGCSRHMTGVKSYLHKYVEQPGPEVVFGDDSTCTTKGYSFIKCNGIIKKGTIFNSNKEVVMIAPRVRDVYVLDMTSSAQESCFFAKASENLNWLWHKRLAHLNFKTINKLAKQNLFIGLPSLTSSIKKCLHLLHMDLFRPVTPRSINHEKYTLVIVDEYSSYIHNHKDHLGKFDEKDDDGYLLGYSLVSKAFRIFNTRRQQTEETYHITKPSVDNIKIPKTERYPPDEYLHPYKPFQRYQKNNNDVSFIEPYEYPKPVILETKVSSDQNGQTDQNDHNDQNDQSVQNDEIFNDEHSEHSNHTNDEQIIVNLPNTEYIQISEHLSSLSVEDTSVQNIIPIPTPPLPIPSMVIPAPQDRWCQDKHIELVNIIDFISEEEPKKDSKALKHLGWVDSMQDKLNQFARNKAWT
ncbi:retrovirus-related pol polyprotein from transposon TNT 1-94, partial [Tanacetum coccineum]